MEEIKLCISGIYEIKNIINNKIYIGSAINLEKRKKEHFYDLRKNKHHNRYLQRSFNKYGENSFKFEVIEYIENVDLLIAQEQHYIDKNKDILYNIAPIAGSNLYVYKSEKTKKQISDNLKGRKLSEEHKQNISKGLLEGNTAWRGKHLPEEMKDKISNTLTGYKHSDEAKYNMSIGHKGVLLGEKNPMAIFLENDVIKIKEMIFNKMNNTEIAQLFKVSNHIIWNIRRNKTWTHIQLDYITNEELAKIEPHKLTREATYGFYGKKHTEEAKNKISQSKKGKHIGENSHMSKLNEKQVKDIKLLLLEGKYSQRKIAKMFNIGVATVSYINTGKIWSHVKLEENLINVSI